MESMKPDSKILVEIVQTKMPFGKYKDTLICNIPVSYLEWMHSKGGFPAGKLGMMLSTVYEIKITDWKASLAWLKHRLGISAHNILLLTDNY